MHCNALMDACIATLFNIQLGAADKGPMLQTATKLQSHQQLREATHRVSWQSYKQNNKLALPLCKHDSLLLLRLAINWTDSWRLASNSRHQWTWHPFLLEQTLAQHGQNNPLLLQRTHFRENKSRSCTWRANIPSLLFAVAVICCWEIVGDEESCDQDGVASKLPPPLPLLLWTLMKPLYRREEPAYTLPFAEIPNLRPSFDTCCSQTGE